MSWLRILVLTLAAYAASLSASAQAVYDPLAIIQRAENALRMGDAVPAIDRVQAYLGAIEELTSVLFRGGDTSDEAVEVLYAESRRLAPANMRGQVDAVMASYLHASNRTGRAKELYHSALTDSEFLKDPVNEYYALVQLAGDYLDQGQTENADTVLERARAAVARMSQQERRQARSQMIPMEMSLRITQGEPEAVGLLWDELKQNLEGQNLVTFLSRGASAYTGRSGSASCTASMMCGGRYQDAFARQSTALAAIFYLNQIRDIGRAKEAERIIRESAATLAQAIPGPSGLSNSMKKEVMAAAIDCIFVLGAGDPVSLAADPGYSDKYANCSSVVDLPVMTEQMRMTPARTFELRGGENNRALTLYSEMIEVAEGVRDSFSTVDRTDFFSGRWRPAYAGIIRIHAREAAASPKAYYDFTMALIASERARARQFGDLTGGNASFGESKEMLDFMFSLPTGTAVVVQTSQDNELVTLGFNRDTGKFAASVQPITASQLDRRVTELVAVVSKPNPDDPSVLPVNRALDLFSHDMLGPTRELLKDATRIIVLTDGALTRLPFGLYTATDGGDPLAVSAEITYALSLRSLRSPIAESDATGFFGAGDPVFPAVHPTAGFTQSQILQTVRSSGATRVEGDAALFNPLRFSRQEISDIAATFDAAAADRLADGQAMEYVGATDRVVLGALATETQAKLALPSARYLHFATHGLVAGDLGLSESAVVLAATPEDDGYLTASEVEKLKIKAALAVLSACNTGSGRVVAGEGVLGLARAFLVAGSRSAMVSLWSVDDESTTAFMIYFYGKLQEGLSPAAALRETSREMRGIYEHPAYWAAFILIAQ